MTADSPDRLRDEISCPPGWAERAKAFSLGTLVIVLSLLTLLRLIGLRLSAVDLFYDEAQYWSWSRDLAFGYYSKPPLLAWLIDAAERVCGSAEWCVRAPAPLLYLATSLVIYALGRTLYDERTGIWAALLTAFCPGLVFSARIISTDVPLLLFWALALLLYVRLLDQPHWRWAVPLGIAIGLGLLAKYAMIYFLPGLVLATLVSPRARALWKTPAPWVALAIAALVVAPNAAWNVANGFVTLKHTGSLVLGEETHPSLLRGLEFLGAQFGVFGPVVFALMLLATVRTGSADLLEQDRIMVAFFVTPIALVTVFAIMVHAYANWAATSFISGVVLAAALISRQKARAWLWGSIALGLAMQATLIYTDVVAEHLSLPHLTFSNPYYRTLGWRAYGESVGMLARKLGARAIVNDSRSELAALLYYWRDQPEKVLSWRTADIPQFDLAQPLTQDTPEPILFVTACAEIERLRPFYGRIEALGRFTVPVGDNGARGYVAFKLAGVRGPISALPLCTGAR